MPINIVNQVLMILRNRSIILILALNFVFYCSMSQVNSKKSVPQNDITYSQLMQSASIKLTSHEYASALRDFSLAFKHHDSIGKYDYANAMLAAYNVDSISLALTWFSKGVELGLGLSNGEYEYFNNANDFPGLKDQPSYQLSLIQILEKVNRQKSDKNLIDKQWLDRIEKNGKNGKHAIDSTNIGFSLYWNDSGDNKVPYLVYIPKSAISRENIKTIVYLHGGVVSTSEFTFRESATSSEPIFKVADSLGFVVIYPFGKKSYGWVDQLEAFHQILDIVKETKQKYALAEDNLYLGGMSNGGTATFWFASQSETPFKSFFTFSGNYELKVDSIHWEKIDELRSIYSFNASDDNIFSKDNIERQYSEKSAIAPGWHLEMINSGGHGFIYDPTALNSFLIPFFKRFLNIN